MREIRPSGSEGGVRSIPHPYPYRGQFRPRPLDHELHLGLDVRLIWINCSLCNWTN